MSILHHYIIRLLPPLSFSFPSDKPSISWHIQPVTPATMKHNALLNSLFAVLTLAFSFAQEKDSKPKELISGEVFPHFKPVKNWFLTGSTIAVKDKSEFTCSGDGIILVNGEKKVRAPYLITAQEYQDVEVHFEFMIPKKSNSGIYIMGRYEIQILDSFGKEKFGFGDLGGLYQRYDNSRKPKPPGFEGVSPKKNAAKAPGEWQTIDIVFRAPRFDADGKKTDNARFIKVAVNGETVHENQEAKGPTRSHPLKGEAAKGPIAIQGDHGPIAIRSFKVKPVDLSNL